MQSPHTARVVHRPRRNTTLITIAENRVDLVVAICLFLHAHRRQLRLNRTLVAPASKVFSVWTGGTTLTKGDIEMLAQKDAMATIAVKDIKRAEQFYRDTLGLELAHSEEPSVRGFRSGKSVIMVYESQYAGTNQATAATWVVGDEVESIAKTLKAKGVKFEHYDMPDTRREGDVHIAGESKKVKVAWFRDPDGNILSITNG